jgi:putative transcriptional regulator
MAKKKGDKGPPKARIISSPAQEASVKFLDAHREPELNEAEREIIGALTDFRDTLRARTPLETKYTVRQVVVVVPPPQLGPEDVRRTRETLGVSQPVFADFIGTSPSTVRSWEQGQKPPSRMARRLLGLIASDPSYWKSRLWSMIEIRRGKPAASERGGLRVVQAEAGRAETFTLPVVARSGRGGPRAGIGRRRQPDATAAVS